MGNEIDIASFCRLDCTGVLQKQCLHALPILFFFAAVKLESALFTCMSKQNAIAQRDYRAASLRRPCSNAANTSGTAARETAHCTSLLPVTKRRDSFLLTSMQVLIIGDDAFTHVEGIKIQAIAKIVGTSLTVRSANTEDGKLALPCLLANAQHISGGNVIAKLLVAACGHTLYPQAPYSPDKRYRAAQIDAWLDYSTAELQHRQVWGCAFWHGLWSFQQMRLRMSSSRSTCVPKAVALSI